MRKNKKQVAIYVRSATDSYNAIEDQKKRTRKHCQFKDYDIFNIYVDSGFSSNNEDKPAYKKMLSDLRQKKFDTVVVYKLDRITRSIVDLEKFLKEINKHNCSLESVCENLDTSSEHSKFLVKMFSLFSHLENELLKERVISGGNEF